MGGGDGPVGSHARGSQNANGGHLSEFLLEN